MAFCHIPKYLMKNSIKIGSILLLTVFISCQEKVESRFNYGLVKSKIENLTKEQAALFDEITTINVL